MGVGYGPGLSRNRLHLLKLPASDLFDARIRPSLQSGVARVMALFIGIVVPGVVAADQDPAWVQAPILIGAVEQVAVEEESVSGLHFAVN